MSENIQAYRLEINPKTAFGGKILGTTLFGQICWSIVERYGQNRLEELLNGYTENKPFLVVSDGFPENYLPLPILPSYFWQEQNIDRKELKKRKWLAVKNISESPDKWQLLAEKIDFGCEQNHLHNSINRQTASTGECQFAPYQSDEIWFSGNLDIYFLLDTEKFSASELEQVIRDISNIGYGRDASIGLGKFSIEEFVETDLFSRYAQGKDALTLASTCPQGLGFDADKSFYRVHTHFGRHGNLAVHGGNPFKKPVLMAETAAVLHREDGKCQNFVGQGISCVSQIYPNTVHQGYAPALWFDFISA